MANQVVNMVSRLFIVDERWDIVPEGDDPCRLVKKYNRAKNCERFLRCFSRFRSIRHLRQQEL